MHTNLQNNYKDHQKNRGSSLLSPVKLGATPPCSHDFAFITHGIDKLVLVLYILWHDVQKLTDKLLSIPELLPPNSSVFLFDTAVGQVYLHANRLSGYRYHLKLSWADIYVNTVTYTGAVPNAVIFFTSFSLWKHGLDVCMSMLDQLVKALGGTIDKHLVNRVDLRVDYHIPGGLSLDLLLTHRVSVARLHSHVMDGDHLGTYYNGSRESGIYCRIYDKSAHLRSKRQSYYYAKIPNDQADSIWRFEFELRRKSLRQFGIHTIDDVKSKSGGLWTYLTSKWLSLRSPSHAHKDQRLILPLWQDIQNRANEFSNVCEPLVRGHHKVASVSDTRWYVSHLAGCLPAFAVLSGKTELSAAIQHLSIELTTLVGAT